ncbi:MAG: helix-turn-helix domain-containing protein [bacterium]
MPYDHRMMGRTIRELRRRQGMTQEVLSGLAAISRSHLAEIETGRDSANVETLWKIADALGIRLSELVRLMEEAMERDGNHPR